MSAKSAVTVLRSPSANSADVAISAPTRTPVLSVTAAAADPVKDAPQPSQNLAPRRFGAPHETHCGCKLEPQLSQNRAVCRLSTPHLEQRMVPPLQLPARFVKNFLGWHRL